MAIIPAGSSKSGGALGTVMREVGQFRPRQSSNDYVVDIACR
jgi:hypothetical protein